MKKRKEGKGRSFSYFKSFLNRLRKDNEKLYVLVRYIYSFLIFAPLFWYVDNSELEFLKVKVLIAKIVGFLLNITGINAEVYSVFVKTSFMTVEIIRDCTGWKSLFVLGVLFFITPKVGWKEKVLGFAVSVPFVFVLTVFRIYSSIYLSYLFGVEKFSFIHDVLWRFGLIVSVIGFWYLWMYWVLKKRKVYRK